MKNTYTGEFAGKQIVVTLSATNPGSWSVSTSLQDDQSLLVGYDGPVTYNGKELRLEITHNSVKVEVVSENIHGKNTLTVVSPKGATKSVDVLPNTKPELNFGQVPNILIDGFPYDIDPPAMSSIGRCLGYKSEVKPLKMNTATVYITAKSATEIHGMSFARIERSGFIDHQTLPGAKVSLHNHDNFFFDVMMSGGGLQRLKDAVTSAVKDCDCRTIMLMIDEAHVGSGVEHQLGLALQHFNFSSKDGGTITVGGQEVSLKICATTATPTRRISNVFGRRKITHIMAESPAEYYGVEKLLSSNRIVNVEKDISAAALAKLLINHPGFKERGVIVLRLPSKRRKNDKFANELSKELGGHHLIKSFDANSKNLPEFDRFVSDGLHARSPGAIAILKDGFSAGFTLRRTDKIAAWVDLHFSDFEALCQSIGRIFGYGKDLDKFPIVTFREQLQMYQDIIVEHRKGEIPSLNHSRTSEHRKGSKLKFVCKDTAKYVVGTVEEFKADFELRRQHWPSKFVKSPMNSDAVNHIVSWTKENIADKFLRPTKTLYARGFDLSAMKDDDGRELTKAMCPKWFEPDATSPNGFRPLASAKTPEGNFNSFRRLRQKYSEDIAAGRTIIWLSAADNVIESKYEANGSIRGKAGNIGIHTSEARHDDPKTGSAQNEAVENRFLTGESPKWITEIVNEVQAELNADYESSGYDDRIFDTAIEPAAKMLTGTLYGEEPCILLTAEMQSGKTGIMILFMHCLPRLIRTIAAQN